LWKTEVSMNSIKSASDAGRELYHAIWEQVGTAFFDTARLVDWGSYEHRFDAAIVDEASALACVDQMLASLADSYSERMRPATSTGTQPVAVAEQSDDVLATISKSKIGYLRISNFDSEAVGDLIAEGVAKIADCEGLILDLRQNSGGRMHLALDCLGHFLNNGLLTTIKFRDSTWSYFVNETQFFATQENTSGEKTNHVYTRRAPVLAGKPLVIIVNRRTASAAEMMVCALVQNGIAGKVLVVGSASTPGKGIGQAEYEFLDGKVVVRITRCHWFAPGGEWLGDCGQTASNGVEPDVLVDGDRGPEAVKVAADELRRMLGRTAPDSSAA
jgi:C-terminal processing protease CtpA/Prc